MFNSANVLPNNGNVELYIAIVGLEYVSSGHYSGSVIPDSGGVKHNNVDVELNVGIVILSTTIKRPHTKKKAFQSPSPNPKGFLFGKSKLMYYNGMFPCFLAGLVRILV